MGVRGPYLSAGAALLLLCYGLTFEPSCAQASTAVVGCLSDIIASPIHLFSVGGVHEVPFSGIIVCAEMCVKMKHRYSAIQNATICLCADDISGLTSSTACDATCADGAACGSSTDLTVFSVAEEPIPPVEYLMLDPLPDVVRVVGDTVTLTVNSSSSFITDWGDGTVSNSTAVTHTYNTYGEYHIKVWLNNDPSIFGEASVLIQSAPSPFQMTCPPSLIVDVYDKCNVTSFVQLFNQSFHLNISSSFQSLSFSGLIPDPALMLYGSSVHTSNGALTSVIGSSSQVILLGNGKVLEDGYIVLVRVGSAAAFTVTIVEATPVCSSGQFCVDSCRPSCTSTCTSTAYCSGKNTCSVSGCPPTTPSTSAYTIVELLTTTTTEFATTGTSEVFIPTARVRQGTYLGIKTTSSIQKTDVTSGADMLLTSSGTYLKHLTYNLDVRIQVQSHEYVTLMPDFKCSKASPVPIANVPQPYDASTSQYAFIGTFNILLQIISTVGTGTVEADASPLCQIPVFDENVTHPLDIWMNFGGYADFTVDVTQGSPLFANLTIDTTTHYYYFDDAQTSVFSWTNPLVYATEGLYTIEGVLVNAASTVNITALVHVVPNITDTWNFVVNCPCYNLERGFTHTLLFPSAAHPPWNATINITYSVITSTGAVETGVFLATTVEDFGTFDGVTPPGGASGAALEITRTYNNTVLTAGNYTLTAIISNEVSSFTIATEAEIKEGIRNVSAEMVWVQGDLEKPGAGIDQSIFISNMTTLITPITATGVPQKWRLQVSPTGEDVIVDAVEGFQFNMTFDIVGPATFIISAYNEIQGWVPSPPINVTFVSRIEDLQLSDDNRLGTPNVTKIVTATYGILTPVSCLVMDWGDNTVLESRGDYSLCKDRYPDAEYKGLLSTPINMGHEYLNEGVFDVKAHAFDMSVTLRSELQVVVADVPCTMPVVNIIEPTLSVLLAPKFIKSVAVSVEGTSVVQCNKTVTIKRFWKIATADNTTGEAILPVVIENILQSWNYSELTITPLFLPYGIYKLTYTVDVQASKIVALMRSAFTYIEIIPSPLSAVIVKGSLSNIKRGYQQNIFFEPGSLSADPDMPGEPMKNVSWFCRQIHPKLEEFTLDAEGYPVSSTSQALPAPLTSSSKTGGGCFGVGPGKINIPETNKVFQVASFYLASAIFEFVAVVCKDTRRAMAKVEIEVAPLPPPAVSIECSDPNLCMPQATGQLINPAVRLGINGYCLDYCTAKLRYQWEIKTIDGNYPIIDDPACNAKTVNCPQSYATDLISSTVIITPTMFRINPKVNKYTIRLVIITSDNRIGYSQITVIKNNPPAGGYCTIKSDDNLALLSDYYISCPNWKDPEKMKVKSYNFYYIWYKKDGTKARKALASTSQYDVMAVLPYGTLEVRVEIWDSLEASTDVLIANCTTRMPTKEQYTSYNMTEKLNKLNGSPLIAMYITAQNSINANANWTSLDSSVLGSKSDEEVDDILLSINDNRAQQLTSMESTPPATSINQVNIAGDVLSSASTPVCENPKAAYSFDMETREKTLKLLSRTSDSLKTMIVQSPTQYEPFMRNALNVVTAITLGINIIMENNDKAPPKDKLAAQNMPYDADVDDEIPRTEEERYIKNVITLMRQQAKSQITRMNAIIADISKLIQDKLVKGEVVSVLAECGASIVIARMGEEILEDGKTILESPDMDRTAKLIVPQFFCPSKFHDSESICRTDFDIRFTIWPLKTHAYSETADLVSKEACSVNIEVFSKGIITPMQNINPPLIFEVPHKPDIEVNNTLRSNASECINKHIPLVYHYINVSISLAAYIIKIEPSKPSDNLVLFIDNNRYPSPEKNSMAVMVNDLPFINETYTLFVDTKKNNNKSGDFVIGVGRLKSSATGIDIKNITREHLDNKFDSMYNFQVIVTGCFLFETLNDRWKSDSEVNCTYANETHTQCTTSHLTEFGTGFRLSPNKVDFELLIGNMGFIDNSTLISVMIILIILYIIMMIWAHWKDKKDFKKRGAIPLPDNNVNDKYIYEVTFHTGPDPNATCKSNIVFMVSGDVAESEVRFLPKARDHLYRRYARNTFVMTTPGPLGPLHYIRVLHDNSGRPPYASWQLDRVVFHDLQKHECFVFEANSWLAMDRGDGVIDRTFVCSSYEVNNMTFSQQMYNQSQRGVNQDHMWLSVFLRPIGSRYCRKERVTVCAVFLYLSMVISAMFYKIDGESPQESGYIEMGPVAISSSEIVAGVLVLIFVFPLCLLLAVVFKRARPKSLRRCRVLDAIENQRKEQLVKTGVPEATAEAESKVEVESDKKPKPKVEVKSKCLPWWARYVAWIICIVTILASAFFVFVYGITWGNITTQKWFASFLISFLGSILISQWIKILIFALGAVFCKSNNLAIEDMDCDEELPHLKQNEKWMQVEEMDQSNMRRVQLMKGIEKTKNIKSQSEELTKIRGMTLVVQDILMYCLFLVVLMIIANTRTDTNAYYMQNHFTNILINKGNEELDLVTTVTTADDFWKWSYRGIMEVLRAKEWYNGAQPYGLRGFLDDRANRMIGYPILRQIRTGRLNCNVTKPMNMIMKECTGMRGLTAEDTRDYCAGWSSDFEGNSEVDCSYPEFKYQTGESLGSYPLLGRLGYYGAGGYVVRLKGTKSSIYTMLERLQKQHWIDKRTRAVLLEFSVYNANVNLFASCTVYIEFNDGGGIVSKWQFYPVPLLKVGTSFKDSVTTICEILFVVSTVFFTLNALWEIKNQKCSYFIKYWNIAELIILCTSYIEIFLWVYKTLLTNEAVKEFNKTKGNSYVRMDMPITVDFYYLYLLGFILFFSVLKLIKLLQFNKRMNVLALTIQLCWEELSYFFIAFTVIFFAFCCLFYFMFIKNLREFSNVVSAVLTSFSMMLGKFDFTAMREANSLSPPLFFVFSVTNSWVLINIMLSIIIQAFHDITEELSKIDNQYNVVEFMTIRAKKMAKFQPDPVRQVRVDYSYQRENKVFDNNEDDATDDKLPDKVSQLVHYINEVYFDGQLDESNPKGWKEALNPKSSKKYSEFRGVTRKIYASD